MYPLQQVVRAAMSNSILAGETDPQPKLASACQVTGESFTVKPTVTANAEILKRTAVAGCGLQYRQIFIKEAYRGDPMEDSHS